MSEELVVLPESVLRGLPLAEAGAMDLRRDIHVLISYLRDRRVVRTVRGNFIPKADALRLAKLLTWAPEREGIQATGRGRWCEVVADVAAEMGFADWDLEGVFAGASSQEPTFPDNSIRVNEPAWADYLARSGCQREQDVLAGVIASAGNEFFNGASLVATGSFGYGTRGPAGQTNLPLVRSELLGWLAAFAPGVWYDFRSLVERLRVDLPELILAPATRGPDEESERELRQWEWNRRLPKCPNVPRPEITLESLYAGLDEYPVEANGLRRREQRRHFEPGTTEGFQRVEGRFLSTFLSETAYLCGFVDLAWRAPEDPHGLDTHPSFERLRAVRLTPRLAQVMGVDPALDATKVTVLPTGEILVEASSYPDPILARLAPYARLQEERGALRTLRLDRQKVAETAAREPPAPPAAEVLASLTANPLPQNIVAELASWSRRGEQVVFFAEAGLLELVGCEERREALRKELGPLLWDQGPEGFMVVRLPAMALARLEERRQVPVPIIHPADGFAPCPGKLGTAQPTVSPRIPRAKPAVPVEVSAEDLVGYSSENSALLKALAQALEGKAQTCVLVAAHRLVFSASALPAVRAALKRLAGRFAVTLTQLKERA